MESQSPPMQQEPEDNNNSANDSNNNNENNNGNNNDDDEDNDPLVWSKDLEKHSCGEFSYALVQANTSMEEHSQVEVGENALFVGIYDGCAGPHASWFILNYLIVALIRNARQDGTINEQTLKDAILATDGAYLYSFHKTQEMSPNMVTSGSSCLVCVIWKGELIIGHIGTSRAVCGMINPSDNSMNAVQFTMEHNVNNLLIRQQLLDLHNHDPDLLDNYQGVWRIKGITEVSRSIGYANLKLSAFRNPHCYQHFQLSSPLRRPAVSAVPFMYSKPIENSDRFFIFASFEFWKHVSVHRAVEIVHTNPRDGIAKRLVKTAMREAARKANYRYSDIAYIPMGWRLDIHDDMTVIVVFINHDMVGVKDINLDQRAFKGLFTDDLEPSTLLFIHDLM